MGDRADDVRNGGDANEATALRRYQTLVNEIDDGVYQLDAAERFVTINDRFVELTGYARDALLGEHVSLVFDETDRQRVKRELSELRTTGGRRNETIETAVHTADGETIRCELRVHPLSDEVHGSVGVLQERSEPTSDGNRTGRVEAEGRRRNEVTFRQLVEHLDQVVWMSTADMRETIYVNSAFEEVYGRDRERLYEDPEVLLDAVHPDDRELLRSELETEVEEPHVIEYRIVQPDGDVRWIHDRVVPVYDDDGNVFRIVGEAMDITERKEHERELEDTKSQLEAATEAGAVGTWEWHVRTDEMIVGPSFARTFGVNPEAARDGVSLDRFVEAVHEDDRDRVAAEIEEVVETCGEYESEYRVRDADGELRWVVARGHIECAENGEAMTFPGALTDITERKRAELRLEQTTEQLATLFEILPVGVVVADSDGGFVEANETAKEIWGGDVFDVESVAEYERYTGWWAESDEPVEPEEWTMSRVLEGEEVTDPDIYEIETVDGARRIIQAEGMPVWDADGDVTRGVVTISDITERRAYQRKLEESNERLEQFAYAASHDLQEPLRMVTSYLQLLESRYADAFDEDGREFLEFAVDGADRMRAMIDGLLEYSRVETRGDPFEPTDLNDVLEDVRSDLQLQIEESGAEITTEDLPRVNGDVDQLRQLFQNLLSNAIIYSGEGSPRVRVDARRRGRQWVISVEDNGIGIDPEDQERIFTVFDRLHSREEYEGTGIGLALCERIVERHGGEIWVDSEAGDGATFSMTLPAARDR
ncbi:PAS/PAC sensor signal transduction histidine kinase [Haloterrigena turkmenica DSM 5511]|uniref:histidine kinase n=1 Tax=Haloterrigena turkmenica (strain ATCC 51198 / DSM 5511 / JCM 9101 / NCIMB 13204 / VKM B-1734 / 4k) TaxID=543526 RepID=D2RV36_HALTV|nr:PAS domain S-box protein [Haloterrigena turkmenica]ADB61237.1 PAS/PAC sensor signal transduction histidine kinase [Haloterrigena turkmenica DSM 5511]